MPVLAGSPNPFPPSPFGQGEKPEYVSHKLHGALRLRGLENCPRHAQELARLGARSRLQGAPAQGAAGLRGAPILATDLRASVSLIIAGLVAQGPPTNSRQDHLGSRKRALDGCAGMPQRTRLCRQSADVRRAGRITESSREGLRGVERYFLDSQSKHNAQQSRALLLAVPANF
jgi:hypothetical protein